MDAAKNIAIAVVTQGYNSSATSIIVASGFGARFPTPPFNAEWWDSTNYPNPADDPNYEIVRVTAISTDTFTIVRGQETTLGGLAASAKNTVGATYKIARTFTAKDYADIQAMATDVGTLQIYVTDDDYNAAGDGVTDDRTAINNAITAGNLILFPPGTFIVGAALSAKSNLTLRGAGIGITTIKLKASAGAEHVLSGSSLTRVTIEDMTIDGNQASNATALDGIHFNGVDRLTIRNVEVINCKRKGIALGVASGSQKHVVIDNVHCSGCQDNIIEIQNRNNDNVSVCITNFHLDNPGGGSGTSKSGIVFSGPVQISNGTIEGVSGTNSCLGIFGREDGDSSAGNGGHDSHIQNVHIKGSTHASNIGEGVRLDCDRCTVQGVMVDSLDYGFRSGTSATTGDDNVFTGCTSNGGDVGFRIEGNQVVVKECKIVGTPTLGIDYRATADEGVIKDNYITGTTKVTVSGTNLHARNNVGWKTSTRIVSGTVDCTSSGTKTTGNVAHGLAVTPSINTVMTAFVVGNGDTAIRASTLRVGSIDGTNVVGDFAVTTAGAAGATYIVEFDIDAYP